MKKSIRYILGALSTLITAMFMVIILSRCASVLTPTGGPKDSLPPVIVNMLPDNFSTNFKSKDVYIEFDEFVQLKDQQKEFFTSPAMKKKPTLAIRGRGIVVTIKDTLLENTTYALNFGSAIRDNNEGNPLNAMRYVFSTGAAVDSMYMSGYTADSYKADSVGRSFIYFFPADSIEHVAEYDSTMFKYKPAVIARAEKNGIFIAQNLKPIKYRVYAVEDTNDNQMYEPEVDQVGFIEEEYNPLDMHGFAVWYDSIRQYPSADPQLYFRMFLDKAFKRQILQETERPMQHQAILRFGARNPKIESFKFDSIPSDSVIVDPLTIGHDTVALWFNIAPEKLADTIKGQLIYFKHDSINNLVRDTARLRLPWKLFETKEQEKAREKLEKEREKAIAKGEEWIEPPVENPFKFDMKLSGEINPENGLSFKLNYPLVEFDSLAVVLTKTLTAPEEGEKADTIAQKVTFERDTADMLKWKINSKWDDLKSTYSFVIPKGAMRDVAGFSNDSLVAKYTLNDPEKFAKVIVNVKGNPSVDAKYIVELLDGRSKLLQAKECDGESSVVDFNYVPAGEIRLRVVEDMNGNGKWDGGNLVERRQPERVEMFSQDGEDTFATKINWEVELDMDMSKIFAPITMESLIRMLDDREAQRLIKQREVDIEAAKKRKEQEHNHNNSSGGSGFGGIGGITQGIKSM